MNVGLKDNRQMCKYSAGCYQKNPMHLEKFKHPEKEKSKSNFYRGLGMTLGGRNGILLAHFLATVVTIIFSRIIFLSLIAKITLIFD